MTDSDGVRFFFYGTLRDADLRAAVLGREAAESLSVTAAHLEGFAAYRVDGEAFPVAVPAEGARVEGVLASGVTPEMAASLQAYEGPEYALSRAQAISGAGAAEACMMFAPTAAFAARASEEAWDFEAWAETRKARAVREAEELALYAEAPAQALGDRLWPDVRARAAGSATAGESVACGFGRGDVEELRRVEPYRAFYGFQEIEVRHRAFQRPEDAGGSARWGAALLRGVLRSGDGVVILPYDPKTDRVLLVEQWRIGPWARGDARPWTIEAVAGRADKAKGFEAIAREECAEEAAVEVGRIERIGSFYSSPGTVDEVLHYYVGEADLSAAGGVFGVPEEGEDIRAFALDYEAAMTALERGDIGTAPPALALYWLARNRERLRLLWA